MSSSTQSETPSVFLLAETLVFQQINRLDYSKKQLTKLRCFVRLYANEIFFLFLRGPHKFTNGIYPEPNRFFYNQLMDNIVTVLHERRGDLSVRKLKQLLSSLDLDRNLNVLILLLLISDIQRNSFPLGTFHLPDESETRITSDNTTIFNYSAPENLLYSLVNHVPNSLELSTPEWRYSNMDQFPFAKSLKSYSRMISAHSGSDHPMALGCASNMPLRCLDNNRTQYCVSSQQSFMRNNPTMDAAFETAHILHNAYDDLPNLIRHATVKSFILDTLFNPCPLQNCESSDNDRSSCRFSWSKRGCPLPAKELPFLTEQKSWGISALLYIHRNRSEVRNSKLSIGKVDFANLPRDFRAERYSFFRDFMLLNMGTSSSRFVWSQIDEHATDQMLAGQFTFQTLASDAIHLNVSDRAMATLLSEHLKFGTQYRQLDWLLRGMPTGDWSQSAPTLDCVKQALLLHLSSYEEALLCLLHEQDQRALQSGILCRPFGLLELNRQLYSLSSVIRFVFELCFPRDEPEFHLHKIDSLSLLRRLMFKSNQYLGLHHEPIVRALFKAACQPFLQFLERLVLDGTCEKEFTSSLPDIRDWSASRAESCSLFAGLLSPTVEQCLLRCARYVCLLKADEPKHYIFTKRSVFPRLRFPTCMADWDNQLHQAKQYVDQLRQAAAEAPVTKARILNHLEVKRETLLRQAAEAQARHAAAYEAFLNGSGFSGRKLYSHPVQQLNRSLVDVNSQTALSAQHAGLTPNEHRLNDLKSNGMSDDVSRLSLSIKAESAGTMLNSSSPSKPDDKSNVGRVTDSTSCPSSILHSTNCRGDAINVPPPVKRNPYGHVSDSTIQHMMYGSGLGPACRPSKWQKELAALDPVSEQPDAITFVEEALASANERSEDLLVSETDLLHAENIFIHAPSLTNHVDSGTLADSQSTNLDIVPLQILLENMVLQPLLMHANEVNAIVCDHILYKLGLLHHLQTMRQLFFFENGVFTQLFMDDLFSKLGLSPTSVLMGCTSAYLHDLIVGIATKFSQPDDAYCDDSIIISHALPEDRLSIRVPIDLTTTKHVHANESESDYYLLHVFDSLTFKYEAPPPLDLVINSVAMAQYNVIFRQLLLVKYSAWAVKQVYRDVRSHATLFSRDIGHSLTIWINEMVQVVHCLESYLAIQALKVNWNKLTCALVGTPDSVGDTKKSACSVCVRNLDDIVGAHEAYLDAIIHCTLLGSTDPELQRVFKGLLAQVLRFCSLVSIVRSCADQVTLAKSWEQLCSAHQSFQQHAYFLRRRAARLLPTVQSNVVRSSLSQLILALGANDFYSSHHYKR